MICEEVQTRISEYLERSLDAISMKSIEVHLSSCARCRVDAGSLADCIQEVAGLPMVDPPLGFAQRVMVHVREINKKPTVWERLFLPTRVKIPLQATAVVLIGALALVLAQKEEKSNKQDFSQPAAPAITSPAPPAREIDQQKESTIVVERSVPEKKAAKSTKPFADLAKQAPDQAQTNDTAAATTGDEQTQPGAAPPPARAKESESRLEDKKGAPRRRAIPAQEISTAGEAMRSRSDTFGFGLGVGAGALREGLSAGPLLERSLSPLSEPNADIEFVVRRRPAQPRDQKDEASFAATGKTAESKRTNPPLAAPRTSSIREIRWFTVAADRFEQFKKALESEAIIESERTPGVIESDFAQKIARELLIKVTISPSEQ